jgi:hypothetical protein
MDPTAVTNIPDVIAQMERIDSSLPRKDGVAYFNRLYLQVTRAVDSASANTTFETPVSLERLDVVFAGLYFAAEATIASGGCCPVPWRPLVQARADRREPIQFALAGMTAHINHDLPVALVETCTEMGIAPVDGSAVHRDYQRVDAILAEVEKQVAGWFDTGLIADIEDVTPVKTDEAIAMWSIVAARDVAWEHAKVMWALRDAKLVENAYLAVLARATELAARAMLV